VEKDALEILQASFDLLGYVHLGLFARLLYCKRKCFKLSGKTRLAVSGFLTPVVVHVIWLLVEKYRKRRR
jgi:hypothetical protein